MPRQALRPYRHIKLTERPDVEDIRQEGRSSRVGRIPRGALACPRYANGVVRLADSPGRNLNEGKIVRNDRGYNRSRGKASVRRQLKRSDRAAQMRFDARAEGVNSGCGFFA